MVHSTQDWDKIDSTPTFIEILDYEGKNLIGMPQDLPNLERLTINGGNLTSLKGISQNLTL